MSAIPRQGVTPEAYLEMERAAEFKSEYLGGEIFAMAGATERHNQIVLNVSGELYLQLKRRACRVYSNDMRVRVSETGAYTYPDVVALCGEPRFRDDRRDTLLNPTVIVEVLSDSTAAYDRGVKFAHYRKLASLQEYLLISQDTHRVEHYARQATNQWLLTEYETLEPSVSLVAIECQLALADIYDKVEISEGGTQDGA